MAIYPYKGRKNEHRIQVDAGVDPATGKRVRPSEIFKGSMGAAKRRETELKSLIDTGGYVANNTETLSDFVTQWFPGKQASIAATTSSGYRRLLDSHILPELGSLPMQSIAAPDIRRFLRSYSERGALSMGEHLFVFLKMLFNAANSMGVINKSPLKGVDRPRPTRKEMRALTPEEWGKTVASLESQSPDALAICTVLLTTGMRRSELAGLRWNDVDIDRQMLLVRRSYHVVRGVGIYKNPKTDRSTRNIALDDETTQLLRQQRNQAQNLAKLADRPLSLTAPVFTPDGVRPYAPDSITHMWQRARSKVGLDDVRLQDLRHTSATLMIAAGVNVGTVADRLGHSTPGFTLSVYRHAVPGEQQDAAKRLAAALDVSRPTGTDQIA